MRTKPYRAFHVALACVLAAMAWGTVHALPINESFEYDAGDYEDHGILGAHLFLTGTVDIASGPLGAIHGDNYMALGLEEFSMGTVSLSTPSNPSNVWVLIYTIPGYSDESFFSGTLDTNTAFAFGVDVDGAVHAYSNETWVKFDVGVPTNNVWLGFVINADYASEKWDLYMATNGVYGEDMQRIGANLDFNDAYAGGKFMSELRVETASLATYLDGLTLQTSFLDVNGVANADANDLMLPERRSGTLVAAPPVEQVSPANTFGGTLGGMMMSGLLDDDVVRVYYGSGNWYNFEVNAGSWDGSVDGLAYEVASGQGIFISFVGTPGLAFITYDAGDPVNPSAPLNDDDDWNLLAWTADAKSPADSSQWGFAGTADDGDRLIVHQPGGGGAKIFQWVGSSAAGSWRDFPNTQNQATYVMPSGRAFWYRNREAGGGKGNWSYSP